MTAYNINKKTTIGEVLFALRAHHHLGSGAVDKDLHTTSSTYLKVERDQRELSFLMTLRACQFYQLDLHEFISLLSEYELNRQDFSFIRAHQQRERRKQRLHRQRLLILLTR